MLSITATEPARPSGALPKRIVRFVTAGPGLMFARRPGCAEREFPIHPQRGKNLLFVKLETDEGLHGWGGTTGGRNVIIRTRS